MADGIKKSTFQNLGGGTYRVTGVMRRSATTGRFITAGRPASAKKSTAVPAKGSKER
ncbi:hypothetical protein [Georgenia sp. MJ170]|uniref:hypothetical protein n=1 Tax=Georgenia sunbinii TaxID=3117728 RepID=UPI002F260821